MTVLVFFGTLPLSHLVFLRVLCILFVSEIIRVLVLVFVKFSVHCSVFAFFFNTTGITLLHIIIRFRTTKQQGEDFHIYCSYFCYRRNRY